MATKDVKGVKRADGDTYLYKDAEARTKIGTATLTTTAQNLSGAVNELNAGKASLENGKVPVSQLPSYVDDVLEYANKASFPATGESGKIYVDLATNLTYRWSGSAYVEISPSLALGETSSTAYAGNKGKANADAIAVLNGTGTGSVSKAITNAINALDVSSVGGTGKYISAISEADGKISATAETMDEVPTQNSNKPVKSDGVFNAINDSVSLKTATGNPIALTDAANANAEELSMTIEPVQDLHGYSKPWPAGAGKNKCNATTTTADCAAGDIVSEKIGEITLTETTSLLLSFEQNKAIGSVQRNTLVLRVPNTTTDYYPSNVTQPGLNAGYHEGLIENMPAGTYDVRMWLQNPDIAVSVTNFMIRDASISDNTFAPYTNICPISGLTEGKVTRTGKNLLPVTLDGIKSANTSGTWSGNTYTFNGVTFKVNANVNGGIESIEVNGTASANTTIQLLNPITQTLDDLLLTAGTTYTLTGCPTGGGNNTYHLNFQSWGQGQDIADYGSGKTSVLSGNNRRFYIFLAQNVTATNLVFKPQLELGTIATEYEPYTATTVTITFGQTVYGGSVNFKTGEVTVTHGMVDLGTLTWRKEGSYNEYRTSLLANMKTYADNVKANALCSVYSILTANQTYHAGNKGLSIATTYISIGDNNYETAADITEAMSGVQLCYELATPTTLTLTPAELELLKGNNTITANGAEISLSYYPDNAIGALAERVDGKADIPIVYDATPGPTTDYSFRYLVGYNENAGQFEYIHNDNAYARLQLDTNNKPHIVMWKAGYDSVNLTNTEALFKSYIRQLEYGINGIVGSGNSATYTVNLSQEKLSYLNNISSDVQTQINGKADQTTVEIPRFTPSEAGWRRICKIKQTSGNSAGGMIYVGGSWSNRQPASASIAVNIMQSKASLTLLSSANNDALMTSMRLVYVSGNEYWLDIYFPSYSNAHGPNRLTFTGDIAVSDIQNPISITTDATEATAEVSSLNQNISGTVLTDKSSMIADLVSGKVDRFVSSSSGTSQTIDVGALTTSNRMYLLSAGYFSAYGDFYVFGLILINSSGSIKYASLKDTQTTVSVTYTDGIVSLTFSDQPYSNAVLIRLS